MNSKQTPKISGESFKKEEESPPKVALACQLNNKIEYEFGGPFGTLAVMIGLPFVIYMLYYTAGKEYCLSGFNFSSVLDAPFPRSFVELVSLFSLEAVLLFTGWFIFQVLLHLILPGENALGVQLKTGERLHYRINGHLAFWVSLFAVLHGNVHWNANGQLVGLSVLPLGYLYDSYLQLITASVICSFLLSAWLYLKSMRKGALLADGGQSGNVVYDFFIGRELNPRTASFDWKFFCELRPGLIGWIVLNLGMAVKQQENLGYITGSMLLINIFQGFYVWDALHNENSILTTMDITTDGFGFMLAFGDLAWVPFTYSLQARYLVDHDPALSNTALLFITGVFLLGYSIFRGSNSQKDQFRRDPKSPAVSHLRTLDTKRGTKLLVSGWWGLARKINYTGDWLIGLSWCLLCGFNSVVPYFYAIYFAVLLIHRSFRDDHSCKLKYGKDWDEYKKLVPARFIPGLF